MPTGPNRKPPLTLRHAFILMLALITAILGGTLFYLAIHSIWLGIFTGGATFVAAWRFYNEFIAD
jgi:hypothetical protein